MNIVLFKLSSASGSGSSQASPNVVGAPEGFVTSLRGTIKVNVPEQINWSDRRFRKSFIDLEQRVLAGLTTSEETAMYDKLAQSRAATADPEVVFRMYQEEARLRRLAELLEELEKLVRPVI